MCSTGDDTIAEVSPPPGGHPALTWAGMRSLAAFIVLACGCAQERTAIVGELDERARSVIVGLVQDDRLFAWAAPADRRLELEPPPGFDDQRAIRVTRIELESSLRELGLRDGALGPAAPPHHPVRSFPRVAVRAGEVRWGEVSALSAAESDERLEELRVAYPPCPSFELREIAGLRESEVSVGLSVGPDGTAIFDTSKGVVLAHRDQEPVFVASGTSIALRSAFSPRGDLWIANEAYFARLDLESRTFDAEIPSPPGACPSGLVVTQDEPLVAYVLDCMGLVRRLEGTSWTIDHTIPAEQFTELPFRRAQMTRLEGDEFVAGATRLGPILRHRNRSYTPELLEQAGRGFPAFGHTRDGRLFAVEERGQTFLRGAEGWRPAPDLPRSTYGFAPYGELDLLLFGTDLGSAGLYSPDAGIVCPNQQLGASVSAAALVRLGDRYLVAGALRVPGDGELDRPYWLWLEARPGD